MCLSYCFGVLIFENPECLIQHSVAEWLRRSPTNLRSLTAVGSTPGRTDHMWERGFSLLLALTGWLGVSIM